MTMLLAQARQLAQQRTTQYRAGVIQLYTEASPILANIDFIDIGGSAFPYSLMGKQPSAGFRAVNGSYQDEPGVVDPQVESLKIAGGDVRLDPFIMRTHGEELAYQQEAMKVTALGRRLNKAFIKGDESTDPKEFDGLQRRLSGSQDILIDADGGPLTMDLMDQLLAAVPGATHFYTGIGGKLLLTRLGRAYNQITISQDQFGNPIEAYAGRPIHDMGLDELDQNIIDFNEFPGSGASDTTSIYAVRSGTAQSQRDFVGIQSPPGIDVRRLGESTASPSNVTRIEWYMNYILGDRNCAARLRGINNAVA